MLFRLIYVLDETYQDLGLDLHPPPPEDAEYRKEFQYASLANPDTLTLASRALHPEDDYAATVYRGMVPAKNILERDFAINGAIVRYALSSIPNC